MMERCKTIQEVMQAYHHELMVARASNCVGALFGMLKLIPEFNDLKGIRYADGTGVITKWADDKEDIFDEDIENTKKFMEDLYQFIDSKRMKDA